MSAPYLSVHGAFITHPGPTRRDNQDAIFFGLIPGAVIHCGDTMAQARAVHHMEESYWMVALADGIGGNVSGGKASCELVTALANCEEPTPKKIEATLGKINQRFHDWGKSDPSISGLGATVVGLVNGPSGLFTFNVGDARLYRKQDRFLTQLTHDDTLASLAENQGLIRQGEPRPMHLHSLTQSVGGTAELRMIQPHIHFIEIHRPTQFLLCTDGLTDTLALDRIEEIMNAYPEPGERANHLFRAAMNARAPDNLTIAIVQIGTPAEKGL
jgi:PPM family protein phosphatase